MRENIRKIARLLREAAKELEGMEKLSQGHGERKKVKYVAVSFAFDGDAVIEDHFSGNTIEEVLEVVSDSGLLYPFLGVAELKEPGKTTAISLYKTNIVYFDLEPIGEKDYDIMVEELSKVLDLPMPIIEVAEEMEKIYKRIWGNRIWGEEKEFEFKKSSRNKRRNKSDSYRR